MSITAKYFGANGWLLDFDGVRILVDPWLKGDLYFPIGKWLIYGKQVKEWPIPKNIDLILLTQGLADHSHKETLELFSRQTPIIGSTTAIKFVKSIGFEKVTALKPQMSDSISGIKITATAGASVPNIENGYLIKENQVSIYIEPHGFLDKNLPKTSLTAVITPILNLGLPLLGSFINGKDTLPKLIELFHPKYIFSSTTGGNIHYGGLLSKILKQVGSSSEAQEIMPDDIQLIDPKPGKNYTINK